MWLEKVNKILLENCWIAWWSTYLVFVVVGIQKATDSKQMRRKKNYYNSLKKNWSRTGKADPLWLIERL